MRRMFQDYIKTGVKDFQAFTGLAQTGELEPPTVELMRTARRKRYVRSAGHKYPAGRGLTQQEVDDTIKKASAFCRRDSGSVHINIICELSL